MDNKTMEGIEVTENKEGSSQLKNQYGISEMDFEEGLQWSGACGRFQIFLQILCMYIVITAAYNGFFSYFILDDPPWKCVTNTSTFCQNNFNETFSIDNKHFSQRCKMERDEWDYTTGKDYSVVTEYDLVCDRKSDAATAGSAFYFGGLVGSLFSGSFADTFGRKPVLVISLLVGLGSSLGCAYVSNIWYLTGLRVVLGIFHTAYYNIALVYLMEFIPDKYRTLSGIVYNACYPVSLALMDAFAYMDRHWRHLQLYGCLPNVVAVIVFIFLPESPRWLLATRKSNKAEIIFGKVARYNGKPVKDIRLKSPNMSTTKKYSYLDLFRCREVAFLTAAQGTIWLTSGMIYYATGLESSSLGGDMYTIFLSTSLAAIPSCIVLAFTADRFGRKKIVLIPFLLAGTCIGSIALVPRSSPIRSKLNATLATLAKFFNVLGFDCAYIWTFELFPTVVRSQGMSFCSICERIGAIAVPYIVSVLQAVHYILPFTIMFVMTIITFFIGFTLPETNGMPTREVYEDFFVQNPVTGSSAAGIENSAAKNIDDTKV